MSTPTKNITAPSTPDPRWKGNRIKYVDGKYFHTVSKDPDLKGVSRDEHGFPVFYVGADCQCCKAKAPLAFTHEYYRHKQQTVGLCEKCWCTSFAPAPTKAEVEALRAFYEDKPKKALVKYVHPQTTAFCMPSTFDEVNAIEKLAWLLPLAVDRTSVAELEKLA